MKKTILLVTVLSGSLSAFAQSSYVKQYFFTSGGSYAAGSANKVKVGVINNGNVTYIDSVSGNFSNATQIQPFRSPQANKGIAHIGRAAGNDLLIRYDLDTYQRLDSVQSSGVQAVAINNQKMVVAKGYGASGAYVTIHDATTLDSISSISQITDECTDVVIYGDSAYVSHSLLGAYYSDSIGYLSIINLNSNLLVNTINLGTKGAGINKLVAQKGGNGLFQIYFSNGQDSLYKIVNDSSLQSVGFANVLAVTNNNIYGLQNTSPKLTAVAINEQSNAQTENPTSLNESDYAYNLFAAYDTLNNEYLVLDPNYTVAGWLYRFAAGQTVDSIQVGISTTALSIDYRLGSVAGLVSNSLETTSAMVFPNPCVDVLNVQNIANQNAWEIMSVQGQQVDKGVLEGGMKTINTEELSTGVYYLVLTGNAGSTTLVFVKQ